MGLFDDITVNYPLPETVGRTTFQTKDTPAQYMDKYEIREDGTLWHEAYDTVDTSDPNAKGISRVAGILTRINKRWEHCDKFTGEIVFYGFANGKDSTGWLEFSSYFKNGAIQQINLIEVRE